MENTNNILNENPNPVKQRHGCVTAWLVLIIVLNSVVAFLYLLRGSWIAEHLPGGISTGMITLLGLLCILNIVFAVMLFQWKKWGFWGVIVTDVIAFIINLSIGLSIVQSALGLLGIGVLYAILQIKQGSKSAWENME
jgi:hypothetical protein